MSVPIVIAVVALISVAVGFLWISKQIVHELQTLTNQLHADQQNLQQLLATSRPEQIGQEVRHSINPLVREVGGQIGGLSAVIAGLAGDIRTALNQTGTAAQQMSASSTSLDTIANQFADAARDLRQSQEQLQQVLQQLSQPSALPEWLGQLHETVSPLRNAGNQIGQHYQYNRDLLDTTQLLLNSWNERGEEVVIGARTISNAFQQWSSEEAQARQYVHNQIDLRLEEVGRSVGELTTRLTNLAHTVNRFANTTDAMQHSSDASRAALEQLLTQQINSQQQHQRAVETLGTLSQTMTRHQETLGAQLQILAEQSRKQSEQSYESHKALQRQQTSVVQTMIAQIQQMTGDITLQYESELSRLARFLETAQQHDSSNRRELNAILSRLPDGRVYIAQIILGLLIIGLLIALNLRIGS